jgi:hypothetical protein
MVYPSELAAETPPEYFSPETLFEIIDGDADLYLKAGFVQLEFRRFGLKQHPGLELEAFVYQMADQRSAFAVYSVRRGQEAVPVALTRFAYRYRKGLFLVHGPYYLEILATDDTPPLAAAMQNLAQAFMAAHAVAANPIPELDLFPPEGLVAESIALYPASAFGFEGFTDLFTARYRLNGKEATAFLRPCPSPAEAAALAAAFKAFLAEYEAVEVAGGSPWPGSTLMRVMDTYTLVFVNGRTVAGVQEAETPELAVDLARALNAGLAAAQ